jgi:hypothetical protein
LFHGDAADSKVTHMLACRAPTACGCSVFCFFSASSVIHHICFLCTVSSGNIASAMQGAAAGFDAEDIHDALLHGDAADAKVSNHFMFCDCACTPDQCCASCWLCNAHAFCLIRVCNDNSAMQAETTGFDAEDAYEPLPHGDAAGTKVIDPLPCVHIVCMLA